MSRFYDFCTTVMSQICPVAVIQCVAYSARLVRTCLDSAKLHAKELRTAFASFRSGVLNPSVNNS